MRYPKRLAEVDNKKGEKNGLKDGNVRLVEYAFPLVYQV